MINVGQIYSYKKIGNFVITNITEEKISRIWQDGSVDEIDINVYDGRMFGVLIAEFGSWQEAVCSNDFKEINGDQYEKIKELEKRLENLTNNYKLLEKKQAGDVAHGQALVDEFGDFEALCEELQNLRNLLKECRTLCKEMIEINHLYKQGKCICPCKESITDILTSINAALCESEEQ